MNENSNTNHEKTTTQAPAFRIHPALLNFIAGTFGGIGGVLAGHPFDTIKVRLQNQTSDNMKYKGTIHCMRTIVKEETVFGLFKGITSPMIGVALVNSLLFGVYGSIINWQLAPGQTEPTLFQIFVAGSGSGFLNSAISCPTELAKIQLQMQIDGKNKHGRMYRGTIDCLYNIYRIHGIRECFRGMASTIARETPSYGVYFSSYEYFCRKLTRPGERVQDLDGLRLMLAGGLGGIASWLVTYPFDVAKTVIQSQNLSNKKDAKKFATMRKVFKHYYRADGYRFFFRGLNATIVRAFPTNAVTFFAYTSVMRVIEPYAQ